MPTSDSIRLNRRQVRVSNRDKALYPDGFTKGDVLDYYLHVAPAIVPHLRDRAVTLKRYPNGVDAGHFFEKNCPAHRPDWVQTRHVQGQSDEGVNYCVLNDKAALLWAVNLAALELHVPQGKATNPNRPTAVVFDFDPGPPVSIKECSALALHLRTTLDGIGLACVAKTSGSKGLHVYVPLNTPATAEGAKAFARTVAELFARECPDLVTASMTRSLRPGRIFIDWSQNDASKTTVCPYSLRATATPGVSTPVTWDEVEACAKARRPNRELLRFGPRDVLDRLDAKGDLFAPLLKLRQKLPTL